MICLGLFRGAGGCIKPHIGMLHWSRKSSFLLLIHSGENTLIEAVRKLRSWKTRTSSWLQRQWGASRPRGNVLVAGNLVPLASCCCSVPKLCPTSATSWTEACQASLSFSTSLSLLKFMSIASVVPSNHLILCHLLLLLPSIFPSIRVFSNGSVLRLRWPECWSFSFSISPSNEYSGLISFRIDWLDLLAVQGTLKSLHQHKSKTSVLWHSAFFFFMVQHSHLYMTTGKTIALTIWTFISKVTSLPFNMLSRCVIALLFVVLPYLSGSTLKPDLCSLANLSVVWPRRDHIYFAFSLSLHFCFFALYYFLHLSSYTWIQFFFSC